MENNDILSVLSLGDHFTVTTEKVIELIGSDRPFRKVLKVSTYAIITGDTLAQKVTRPIEPTWWVAVSGKVCKHKRTSALYVLSMLDKAAGYRRDGTLYYPVDDETGLIDMECPFGKKDFAYWIPKTVFDGETFCLPFSRIIEITHSAGLDRPPQPMTVPTMAQLQESMAIGVSVGSDLPF